MTVTELTSERVSDPSTAGHYLVFLDDAGVWRIGRTWKEPDEVRPRTSVFDLAFIHKSQAVGKAVDWVLRYRYVN